MSATAAVSHRHVQANGIRMHIAEQGQGPLVLLCHGWPESWYSWRHQLAALAEAGFHAVAPDMRGYGETDCPRAVDDYTILHLVGDLVGLMQALGEHRAVLVGHDWGALVAWAAALMRPDLFRGVAGMSVPFVPRGDASIIQLLKKAAPPGFYILHFQQPGVAEAEFDRDPVRTVRLMMVGGLAAGLTPDQAMVARPGLGLLDNRTEPDPLPAWLTAQDVAFYGGRFAKSGFAGGVNWYRNMHRNWELQAPWHQARIGIPALFIAGTRDAVLRMPGMMDRARNQGQVLPQLRRTVLIEGAGHWIQQERPQEVNAALVEFARGLPAG